MGGPNPSAAAALGAVAFSGSEMALSMPAGFAPPGGVYGQPGAMFGATTPGMPQPPSPGFPGGMHPQGPPSFGMGGPGAGAVPGVPPASQTAAAAATGGGGIEE